VAFVLVVLLALDIAGVDDFGLRLALAAVAGVVAGLIQLLLTRRREDAEPGDFEQFRIERVKDDAASSWEDFGTVTGVGSDPAADAVKKLKRPGIYRVTSGSGESPDLLRAIRGGFVRRYKPPAE